MTELQRLKEINDRLQQLEANRKTAAGPMIPTASGVKSAPVHDKSTDSDSLDDKDEYGEDFGESFTDIIWGAIYIAQRAQTVAAIHITHTPRQSTAFSLEYLPTHRHRKSEVDSVSEHVSHKVCSNWSVRRHVKVVGHNNRRDGALGAQR